VCPHRVTCLVWVSFAAPAFAYVQVHEASSVLHLVFIYDFKELDEVPADVRLSLACRDKSSYRISSYDNLRVAYLRMYAQFFAS